MLVINIVVSKQMVVSLTVMMLMVMVMIPAYG